MILQGKVPVDFEGGGYGIFNLTDDVLSLAGWYPILAVYDDEGWNIDPVSSIGDSVYSDIAYYTVEVIVPGGYGACSYRSRRGGAGAKRSNEGTVMSADP